MPDKHVDPQLREPLDRVHLGNLRAKTPHPGHTAIVQAVPSGKGPLNQGHARAQPGRASGTDQSRGPGPDHHQVVRVVGSGICVIGRVDAGQQQLVVLVARFD